MSDPLLIQKMVLRTFDSNSLYRSCLNTTLPHDSVVLLNETDSLSLAFYWPLQARVGAFAWYYQPLAPLKEGTIHDTNPKLPEESA
jgi:hypothetical protein